MLKRFFIRSLVMIWAVCLALPETARADDPADTMLMFVGENLEVLSIASRREESARQAPAVATVITKEIIKTRGMFTLGEALEQVPGFYMAQKEWGTRPYLRGIPDSVLFLYDTVPMQSDIAKSMHPLDDELSLAPVKRIEIIRGPGSVLWGADAFAGIVNVVPMTGKDLSGVETGIFYGGPGHNRGGHVNAGYDAGGWDAFLSVIGREGRRDDWHADIVRFWDNGSEFSLPFEDRLGQARPDRPHFIELVGNINIRDWATLSGRYSDYTRPYSMSARDQKLFWMEERSNPVNYMKLEAKKHVGAQSALRFTGYYSEIDSSYEVINRAFDPSEYSAYGELIYDRNFLSGRGLLTVGGAYRKKNISDAPIWGSYLPDYLGPENTFGLLPIITPVSYQTELWSAFGQYSHKIGQADVSLGVRHDAHDTYEDSLSYNLGFVWSPVSEWMFKALYGTAYRTPFASQLIEEDKARLEEIKTTSLEVSWEPRKRLGMSLCGFVNRISDHIAEDAYAGRSRPNRQEIYGIELEGWVSPIDTLDLGIGITALRNSGPDETYNYIEGWEPPRPDVSFALGPGYDAGQPNTAGSFQTNNSLVPITRIIEYPFDTGPDRILRLTAAWEPVDNLTIFCRTIYFSSQHVICPTCDANDTVDGAWRADAALRVRDVLGSGVELGLVAENIADTNYQVPGAYGVIDGDPFSMRLMLTKTW